MDGTFHALEEHLDDHPNGRCAMVPVLKGEEGAGPGWETGAEWLARQGPEVQEKVLGRAGAAAYRAGAVQIEEYVGQRRSREWGSTRYARGLREILGDEEARKWIAQAAKTRHSEAAREVFASSVRNLGRSDMLTVGQLRREIVRLWSSDPEENLEVILTGERRDHILERHPDMEPYLGWLREAVLNPNEVHPNRTDHDMAIFYCRITGTRYLRVAVLMQQQKGPRRHSIISARQARPEEVARGRAIWRQ